MFMAMFRSFPNAIPFRMVVNLQWRTFFLRFLEYDTLISVRKVPNNKNECPVKTLYVLFCFVRFLLSVLILFSLRSLQYTWTSNRRSAAWRFLYFVYTRTKNWMNRSLNQIAFFVCVLSAAHFNWDAIVYRHCVTHERSAKYWAQLLTFHKLDNWNPVPVYWKKFHFLYLKTRSLPEKEQRSSFIFLKHHIEKYRKIYWKWLFSSSNPISIC